MEQILYFFLPTALVFKLFITKKETNFELFIKYLSICFVNNYLCALCVEIYFPNFRIFEETIDFFLKYSLFSVFVGLIMAIIYRIVINFWKVKFEVVNESKKN